MFFWIAINKLSLIYLIPVLSFPAAYTLIEVMNAHVNSPDKTVNYSIFMGSKKRIEKIPLSQRNFMMKFFLVQNVLYLFSILLCLAIIIDKPVIK